MFDTPYNQYELISKKMKQVLSCGKGKNTRKPIYWSMTDDNGIKRVTAYQHGGAKISMTVVPSVDNLYELADFSHDGRFQQSVDLLATITEHKGSYQRTGAA